ncbi:uncharacterized protein LOC105423115 [Pogonomyrmex barbatus]|uniref:Uncharacterized protein LOC105423115 n=1 Tax=Pogonomyrmex barbatus TaxID=144034 RepID=A0A6I9WH88_9HYME|nr:uncharacterized protein LOC105423115 [Pogonomyrmex barbatus]
MRIVRESLTIGIHKIYAWSDSSVVLTWIAGEPSRQKTFVDNRVSKIQSILPSSHWGHVAGTENPADLISRGINFDNFHSNSLWWTGPPWLSEFKDPCQGKGELSDREFDIIQSEKKGNMRVFVARANSESIIETMFSKFSSLTKIERVLAWCYRFITNSRNNLENRNFDNLSVRDLHLSQLKLIKHVQEQFFTRELDDLINDRVNRNSALAHMSPFLDNDGILRVGGRLQRSAINHDKKHPILLPARCRFVELLFEREHCRMLHAGPQALLSSIRERFWPLNGRNTARRITRRCVTCFRVKPRLSDQIMGSLPPDRVTACQRVFSTVGIDYAGPIVTVANKDRGQRSRKSYIALFICFSTKAVHLEAVSELTSSAFLAALRRFVSRRGYPQKIYSDNATNFVGAKRELEELYRTIRTFSKSIEEYCTSQSIEWKLSPPCASHGWYLGSRNKIV